MAAVKVTWVRKGARKRTGTWLTYEPTMVILEGWVDVRVPDTFGEAEQEGPVTVRSSRGLSFDPMWAREADAAIKASGARVLKDFRGYNAH